MMKNKNKLVEKLLIEELSSVLLENYKQLANILGIEYTNDEGVKKAFLNAEPNTQKNAFRQMSRLYHPDVNKDVQDNKNYQEIASLYNSVKNRGQTNSDTNLRTDLESTPTPFNFIREYFENQIKIFNSTLAKEQLQAFKNKLEQNPNWEKESDGIIFGKIFKTYQVLNNPGYRQDKDKAIKYFKELNDILGVQVDNKGNHVPKTKPTQQTQPPPKQTTQQTQPPPKQPQGRDIRNHPFFKDMFKPISKEDFLNPLRRPRPAR